MVSFKKTEFCIFKKVYVLVWIGTYDSLQCNKILGTSRLTFIIALQIYAQTVAISLTVLKEEMVKAISPSVIFHWKFKLYQKLVEIKCAHLSQSLISTFSDAANATTLEIYLLNWTKCIRTQYKIWGF